MDILDTIGINIASPIESGAGSALSNAQFIISLIRNGLILLFAVVIIAAVIYAAISGLKFVRSEGASEKVEEAQESIKYTLIGVAAAFLGVIGVVVISAIFAPNSQAELAMRCAFGDFYLCGVQIVDLDENASNPLADLDCEEETNNTNYHELLKCRYLYNEGQALCIPKDTDISDLRNITELCEINAATFNRLESRLRQF